MREQKSQFKAEDIQDLTGYVVIVTGGKIGLHGSSSKTNSVYQETQVSAMKRLSVSPCTMLVSISQAARQSASAQLSII